MPSPAISSSIGGWTALLAPTSVVASEPADCRVMHDALYPSDGNRFHRVPSEPGLPADEPSCSLLTDHDDRGTDELCDAMQPAGGADSTHRRSARPSRQRDPRSTMARLSRACRPWFDRPAKARAATRSGRRSAGTTTSPSATWCGRVVDPRQEVEVDDGCRRRQADPPFGGGQDGGSRNVTMPSGLAAAKNVRSERPRHVLRSGRGSEHHGAVAEIEVLTSWWTTRPRSPRIRRWLGNGARSAATASPTTDSSPWSAAPTGAT